MVKKNISSYFLFHNHKDKKIGTNMSIVLLLQSKPFYFISCTLFILINKILVYTSIKLKYTYDINFSFYAFIF